MNNRSAITGLWFALFLVALLAIYNFTQVRKTTALGGPQEAVFSQVLKNKELRVGYFVEPPFLAKDANGRLSGIFYDVTEELGRRLDLRIVWVEEANLSTLSLGFETNRYDLIAFALWRNAARSKSVAFSTPLFYSTVGAYVRVGDSRFDGDLTKVNDPSITVAGIDGELAVDIAATDFPKAKISSLPNLTDYSQMLTEVTAKKADITFFSRVQAKRFMKQNPGKIQEVKLNRAVRVYGECLILPLGESKLQSMINSSLAEMIENGVVAEIFRKNGEPAEDYSFPAHPYRNFAD